MAKITRTPGKGQPSPEMRSPCRGEQGEHAAPNSRRGIKIPIPDSPELTMELHEAVVGEICLAVLPSAHMHVLRALVYDPAIAAAHPYRPLRPDAGDDSPAYPHIHVACDDLGWPLFLTVDVGDFPQTALVQRLIAGWHSATRRLQMEGRRPGQAEDRYASIAERRQQGRAED